MNNSFMNKPPMDFRHFFSTNTWWGKLLGAFFGYQIGGPIGAFFGVLIGNVFDKGFAEHYTKPFWIYQQEQDETVKQIFFEAMFTLMGYIAKSDGRVSETEINMAKQVMTDMHLKRDQKKQAQHFFNLGKTGQFDLSQLLNRLEWACKDRTELLRLFIKTQYQAAAADPFTENKIQAINSILRRLGFSPVHQQQQFYEDFAHYYQSKNQDNRAEDQSHYQHSSHHKPHTTLAQAYAILEVTPASSQQEVKKSYRRLISRNHPDKLIAKGADASVIKAANEKTQKITKAYEMICESKGW